MRHRMPTIASGTLCCPVLLVAYCYTNNAGNRERHQSLAGGEALPRSAQTEQLLGGKAERSGEAS